MQHFLEISQLSQQEAESLIHTALSFKTSLNYPSYSQFTAANLFYENSTRTQVSFQLAAHHLKLPFINLDLQRSSEQKGEVIADTVKTLSAMGISVFIIRHSHDRLPHEVASEMPKDVHIINAGSGQYAHPSQAILDMMTIIEHKPNLSQLKIAVIGDLLHSRVANSFQSLCSLMGVGELSLIAPKVWQPKTIHYGQVTTSLKEGLQDADVVMCLRVQRERLNEEESLDLDEYRNMFALTSETLGIAKSNAIVLHPGPMNRGVEIDSEVADGSQSVILQQVKNGVFARMAILQALLY
ncbi:aspartate carbamoyltransferase catalytic subunit [Legionella impletisoli]|uniref:Aspartate carbamoyltransferase n=1 Tax=Legionella impletisoli TaxID=343510 RepID=A0A917JW15_9GAMM|nr:aspartate carbamoyltransferase catalytic subunit [Legionella impletisoli]GGI90007.1 aspartate carbamoyltransferase [Legionella impletisoli]